MSASLSKQQRRLWAGVSLFILFAVWQLAAYSLQDRNLPSPIMVFDSLWSAIESGDLPHHLAATLRRLAISFSASMLIGAMIGILMGRYAWIDALFDQWLVLALNIPALVTIILCYLWFGLVESAAIVAVIINKVPNVIVTFREGSRALRRDLLEMARCYRIGTFKTWQHIIWPQMHPFFMAATRSGLALIWKIILVVELLGRSDGMGYQLHLFFQLGDVASLLAYSLAFVMVIQALEWWVLKPLDAQAQKWRR